MRVLVVGGSGYIGGGVTDLLETRKHQYRVYDNLIYEDSYRKPCYFIYGDIRDHDKLKKQLDWADTVVWLAALVGDGACQINPLTSKEINQDSVKWLSENFNGRIIYCSTCSVYGASNKVLNEMSETNPLSVYAATKLEGEKYLQDKDAIIFRLGTVYGVSDCFSRIRFDLVLNIMTMRAMTTGSLTVFGGDQWRPLVHVKDVGRAILRSLSYPDKTGTYNLATENIKIIGLASKIANTISNTTIKTTDMKFEDNRNYRVSYDKIENNLGFSGNYDVYDGIGEIADLIDERRIKNIDDIRHSNYEFLKVNEDFINVQ